VSLVASVTITLAAQTNPETAFDAVSIKPSRMWVNRPVDNFNLKVIKDIAHASVHGRLGIPSVTANVLIQLAYNVADFQIRQAPAWSLSERYDVEAKAVGNLAFKQMQPLLQTLLAERFRLKLHTESIELPAFELVMSESRPRMLPAKQGSCVQADMSTPVSSDRACGLVLTFASRGVLRIEARGVTLQVLADELTDQLHKSVYDKTGLAATFDFNLDFRPPDLLDNIAVLPTNDDSGGPTIFQAITKQLGLRLRSIKAPTDVLVIDHIEKPSAN